MPRQLKNLVIREVSSVDKGAADGARVLLIKREFSDKERQSAADSGAALPDGSFPIKSKEDLKNAIQAIGRAKDRGKAMAHIKARAKALGAEDMLPDDWQKSADVIDMTGLLRKDGAMNFDEANAAQESREAANEMIDEVNEAICAFSCSVQSILCDEEVSDKNAAIRESFDQFKTHLAGLSPEDMEKAMTPDEIKKQVETQVAEAVKKAGETHAAELAKRDLTISILKMSAEHQKHADTLSDADKAKFAAMSPEERDKEMEKTKKSMDPEIKKQLDQAVEDRKILKALQEKDQVATFAKRATDLGLPAVHGEVMRKAYAGDAEAIKKHEEMLKGLAEQVRTGKVFAEFGNSQQATGATAYEEFMAKAAELRKAKPDMTEAMAFDKVFNDPANAELKKRYDAEEVTKRSRAA